MYLSAYYCNKNKPIKQKNAGQEDNKKDQWLTKKDDIPSDDVLPWVSK